MSNKRYTIREIARLAGVSTGTVDRVIHNRGEVSENSRIRVEQPLKRFEYKPKQGPIKGNSCGKTGSWNGDEAAERFENERKKFVMSIPESVDVKNLEVKKTDIYRNHWVIADKISGKIVLDGNGFGFKNQRKAKNLIRYIANNLTNRE